ncbi:MAG: zinc-binding dehydrogenase [Acidimicrobiales bacterium]
MRAIRQYELGGPETLRYDEVDDPRPGEGQVRVVVHAAGVHVIDTSIRRGGGFGPPPQLPMTPGREVAGVIDALGPHVEGALLGRRVVGHLGDANGGYASMAVADVGALIALADHVGFAEAVAMVGTGRTTLGILEAAAPQADDVVVITAAAGGIGALLVQAIHRRGATVVGAAGSAPKARIAEEQGADVGVDYSIDGWADEVRARLDGRAVTLALDGVGGPIGRAAFELVGPRGRMVLYGFASGEPMTLGVGDLFARGVTVSAAIGARVASRPGGLHDLSVQALDELAAGRLQPLIHPPFELADAADAHRAIEARATTGKVVLVPADG